MHRLLPRRSSLDAPVVAANVLLRWLSLCVLFCLLGTAGFYLLAQLSEDVSVHRRDMNAAAYRAQLYFDHREALLNYLVDSVVESPLPAAAPARPDDGQDSEVQRLPLGPGRDGRQLSLLLSARAEQTMADFGAHLLHVSSDPQAPRQWLQGRHTPATPPPAELTASVLRAHAGRAAPGTGVYWLPANHPGASIYLYRAAEEGADPAHWLVLALDPAAVADTVSGQDIGEFLLLDQRGQPVLSSPSAEPPTTWLRGQHADAFAFVWAHGIPKGLALVKSIGQDGWRLVYHLPAALLLRDMAVHIAVSLLVCLAAIAALRLLIRRIDRQLIQPAHRQHLRLLESFDFGSTVIEMAPVGMCVLRCHDARVMLENQLARDWLGSDTGTGDWTGAWRRTADLAQCTAGSRRPVDVTTADGRQLQVLYAATRYHGDDVLLCVFNDISRHRQIQAALSSAKQAADEASQAKSAFVATMSHEIRTPLYGVLGTLELLGNTALDPRQAEYLKTIRHSSSVLLQLISDILDVSKIESGQLTLATTAFSPLDLAETTLRAYAAAAARKQLQMVVCTDPRLPAQLTGDADRIRQVLGNLLSNAIKFTDSGRVVLRVKLLACEGGTATVSWQVTDTGIGIAAAEHARLFEPFRQADGQGRSDGTGLGLSISDHLVRLMNGDMRLVSEPGLGSSFTVILPLGVDADALADAGADGPRLLCDPPVYVRAALAELADSACQWLQRWGASARRYSTDMPVPTEPGAILVDSDPRDAVPIAWAGPRVIATADAGDPSCDDPARPDQLTVTTLSIRAIADAVFRLQHGNRAPAVSTTPVVRAALGLHVLIAEDNPINRLILKEQLETLGCSVVTACDGHEALACCTAEEFDVVLTDINMPGLGGHALARRLRQQGHAMPVIGATANATPEERERCLAGGMTDYLVKPIDIGTLRHALGGLTAGAPT
ncbi:MULTISPECIES: response regulator [unclassified Stenotrophomonas]|uniref:response regulator n=1 Tax=unclassified Stenotrophomonas TaxID=196198 RepID=UPI0021195FEB|nr:MULTISPECIES: response regulator [unclassified Stenotrophomonas]